MKRKRLLHVAVVLPS